MEFVSVAVVGQTIPLRQSESTRDEIDKKLLKQEGRNGGGKSSHNFWVSFRVGLLLLVICCCCCFTDDLMIFVSERERER